MTLLQFLQSALRLVTGADQSFNPASNSEIQDAKEVFNLMLDSWSNEGLMVYAATLENITLVSGTASYTWGTGGTIATARPVQLEKAYIRDGDIDYPVEAMDRGAYFAKTDKTTTGRPEQFYFDPLNPLATLYLYPVPDSTYTLTVSSVKPLAEITTLSNDVAFPQGYLEALRLNLAMRLAPEYDKQLDPMIIEQARYLKARIKNRTALSRMDPIVTDLGYSGGGDIFSF